MKTVSCIIISICITASVFGQQRHRYQIRWNDLPDGIVNQTAYVDGWDVNDAVANFRGRALQLGVNALMGSIEEVPYTNP